MNTILTPQNLLWGENGVWMLSCTRCMERLELQVRFLISACLTYVCSLGLSFSTY